MASCDVNIGVAYWLIAPEKINIKLDFNSQI